MKTAKEFLKEVGIHNHEVGRTYGTGKRGLRHNDGTFASIYLSELLDQYAKEQRIKFGVFVCKSVNTERISDGDELKIIEELDEQFINQKKK